MQLKDIARRLSEEVWAVFEPILPLVIWCGNGRPPKSNRECYHALLYVLARGIAWEMLPPCFPSSKTVPRRLKRWLERDAFRTAWRQLAERYECLNGINRDQVLLNGSKKPSKKGGNRRALRRLTGASAAWRCPWPATTERCPWGWSSPGPTPTTASRSGMSWRRWDPAS